MTVRPDRSFNFELRTPTTAYLLLSAAGVKPVKNKLKGAGNTGGPNSRAGVEAKGKASFAQAAPGNAGQGTIGSVSLKHVWEIAKIKQSETRLSGIPIEGLVGSVISQAGSMGVVITP